MTNADRIRLLKSAKNYGKYEFQLFVAETGWEDWMNEFTEAEEGKPISEQEGKEIDNILEEIFDEAHEDDE